MKNVLWSLGGDLLSRACLFLSTIAVARMLGPGQFGKYALLLALVAGLTVLRDLGLGASLVTRRDGDVELADATLAIFLTLGGGLGAIVGLLGAALLATRDSAFGAGLVVVGLMFAVSSPSWYLGPEMQRAGRIAPLMSSTVLGQLVAAIASVGLVAAGQGVPGAAGGQLLGATATVIAQLALSDRFRPRWDRALVGSALHAARPYFAQSGVAYLFQNIDNWATGILVGPRALGLYAACYKFAELPYTSVVNPLARVAFPRYAQARHNGLSLLPEFRRVVWMTMILCAPISVFLMVNGRQIISAAFGSAWTDAVQVFAVLGVWGVLRPLQATYGWLLNGAGLAGVNARVALWMLPVTVGAVVAGAEIGGAVGVSAAVAVDVAASFIINVSIAVRWGGAGFARALACSWDGCAASMLAVAGTWLLGPSTPGSFGTLALEALVFLVVYASVLLAISSQARGLARSGLRAARSMAR